MPTRCYPTLLLLLLLLRWWTKGELGGGLGEGELGELGEILMKSLFFLR